MLSRSNFKSLENILPNNFDSSSFEIEIPLPLVPSMICSLVSSIWFPALSRRCSLWIPSSFFCPFLKDPLNQMLPMHILELNLLSNRWYEYMCEGKYSTVSFPT